MAGRDFTVADEAGAPKIAIVNETMARDYFGDTNPIGRHVSIPGWKRDPSWLAIVGVMNDTKNNDVRATPAPMLYVPLFQEPEGRVTFEVRTAIDPHSAIRAILQAVKSVDSRLPVSDIKTLKVQVNQSLIQERSVALSACSGCLALLLAAVGLYGLMTYAVNRRTGEIGIRMALGARREQIARMIFGETLDLLAIGLLIGIPAGIAASRLIASELYGVKPDDPLTIAIPAAVMACIAILASWLPARRASRVDPMTALRHE